MALPTLEPSPKTQTFPAEAIRGRLEEELHKVTEDERKLRGELAEDQDSDAEPSEVHLDSLLVVELLCVLEDLVGHELPHKLVQSGGYASISEAVTHLMDGIEQEWAKHNH